MGYGRCCGYNTGRIGEGFRTVARVDFAVTDILLAAAMANRVRERGLAVARSRSIHIVSTLALCIGERSGDGSGALQQGHAL